MLDAVLITSQPYNSSNTLANSVGYAMWNNVLYNKVGTLWKITSSGTNYNPCSVDSAYDVTDYNNLRCINNYTYDSGWQYVNGMAGNAFSVLDISSGTVWFWENEIKTASVGTSSFLLNGYTYYKGGFMEMIGLGNSRGYQIKRTRPMTEYKSFSSF